MKLLNKLQWPQMESVTKSVFILLFLKSQLVLRVLVLHYRFSPASSIWMYIT